MLEDLRSRCSVLLRPIQPLLPAEQDTRFPNPFDISRSSDVLGRVALDEDEIGPQPRGDSSSI